ncbi:MAG: Beta-glucosidase A [Candidatus Dichloromethanomonas elyunquensis]|nr:MAG: Beta-glucosidase A [Candidatus Dichloromethanomonas elyunquensis]
MPKFKLNDQFLFGTATSSVQIEGGDKNNTWYKWCETGHITDSSSCMAACDHWNRVMEDTLILKNLNVQTHRISLEWSRIEPSPGQFSKESLQHYRNEIQLLLDNQIKPLVTLHHFSEPLWFQEKGGWLKSESVDYFIQYARYVVENLGDLVCEWVTFNEPNVYTWFGYVIGSFPPGIISIIDALQVTTEIIKTHAILYTMIHRIRKEKNFLGKTAVGSAVHIRVFDGLTFAGKKTAQAVDYCFHELFMEGITTGKIKFPLPKNRYPLKKGRYVDFVGINYYTRNIVEFALDPKNFFHKFIPDKDLNKSDLGWDIYPEGIYRICKKYYERYHLPIYITENGISDRYDNRRPDFIINHLSFISEAIENGIKVERYYHWSVMDNFEWLEGESAKFGLYECDFSTQKRTPRHSAQIYAEICKNKAYSTV